ncbi:MAG: hypothetical protein Q4G27_04845 [Flavobacteriaceae bacterium]|nr:hypothetical protein [Flavobacteriaceae bacterium]
MAWDFRQEIIIFVSCTTFNLVNMNLKYLGLFFSVLLIGFTSCKNDDDGNNLLPQEEQNQVDDATILKFLNEHYFNEVGKITKFRDDVSSDDAMPSLMSNAERANAGYWFVKRPGHLAEGRSVVNPDNDSILIQYELLYYNARKNGDSVNYSEPVNFSSTINTTGYPIWDPSFYHHRNSTNDNRAEWYEMEGVQDGLKHFQATGRSALDLPAVDFQGVIVVPSRLVFGRDRNTFGFGPDTSVILNFELYQVIDRN